MNPPSTCRRPPSHTLTGPDVPGGFRSVTKPVLIVAPTLASERPLARELARRGIEARYAGSAREARALVREAPPGWMLALAPSGTAGRLGGALRRLGTFPVLATPAPLSAADVAACREQGVRALACPVSEADFVDEILAALDAERDASRPPAKCELRLTEGVVVKGGRQIPLTPTERDVLRVLAERRGHVVPTSELIEKVWGKDAAGHVHLARLNVRYLRAKLEDDPKHPRLIITHRGIGYRLAG